jgi:Lantibiotic dehydratase, N terminus
MTVERPALGGGWTLWRHALVRGAGFPFALLDEVFRAEDWEGALRRVAEDPRFREAVTWQNRSAVVNGLDPLLRSSKLTSKTRRQLSLVARYLQRYCAKNDTIGFFGPVGWARVGGEPHFQPGAQLLAARAAFLEPWAVLALAQCNRTNAPVTLPGHLRISRGKLIGPAETIRLTPKEQEALLECGGNRLRFPIHANTKAEALPSALQMSLAARGIVRWEHPVSIALYPEPTVSKAAGDPARLGAALEALEHDFESRTQLAPRRDHPWGRGLVFEECRRDIAMDLGVAAIERIAPALQVVLRIARWYTFTIARRLVKALHREHGGRRVPLPEFWLRTEPLFGEEIVQSVAAELRERMRKFWLLGPRVSVDDARAFVARYFRAPCPGWPGARHHAPDLMFDVPSVEALLAGEGTPILSELHPGVTPFTTLSVLSLCPVREELEEEWERDFPEPLVSPIPWEEFARSTHDARLAKRHYHLDLGDPFASDRPPSQVLRSADFNVVESDGRLLAVSRRHRFDLLTVFERRIKLRAATAFSLGDGADVSPRRSLGDLVLQRAQWRVAPDRIGELDLPERVYVRVPSEIKPIYVDFRSPVSREMLTRFTHDAPYATISEMLPGPEGLWLRDAEGRRYTSELRLIATDPHPHDPKKVWSAAT